MLLHLSQFPGGMWAGNCIIAVEGSCVILLAADDAIAPTHDTKWTCMRLARGTHAKLSLQGEVTAWGPGLLDGCFLFSRLASKSQPKQKRREDVGSRKR